MLSKLATLISKEIIFAARLLQLDHYTGWSQVLHTTLVQIKPTFMSGAEKVNNKSLQSLATLQHTPLQLLTPSKLTLTLGSSTNFRPLESRHQNRLFVSQHSRFAQVLRFLHVDGVLYTFRVICPFSTAERPSHYVNK